MATKDVVERIEAEPDNLFFQEHLARYRFAADHLQAGRALDIATGTGYGADLLSQIPGSSVVGVDVDRAALQKARRDYSRSELSFVRADGIHLPFAASSFQTIVTLETLEHIDDDRGYLAELARVLRPDGVCVLSTPNQEYSRRHRISNPYHVREYTASALRRLLKEYFANVDVFYQGYGDEYHAQVVAYQRLIQQRKRNLSRVLRIAIDRIYRPLKPYVPLTITNLVIQRTLKLSYPQPSHQSITISSSPVHDFSVFVAVLQAPRRVQGDAKSVVGASQEQASHAVPSP